MTEPPRGSQWDSTKAAQNVIKHGVAFAEAATVFDDPAVWIRDDDTHIRDDGRLLATGRAIAGQLLTVSCMTRGDGTRTISAQSATGEGRRHYDEQGDN